MTDTQRPISALDPILYTAWADGVLDQDEVAALTRSAGSLSEAGGPAMHAWLDPARPPSATELAALRAAIKSAIGERETGASSLAELGAWLAESSGQTLKASEVEALRELERDLGFEPRGAVAELLAEPAAAGAPASAVDADAVRRWLDGPQARVIDRVRGYLEERGTPPIGLPMEEHRGKVTAQVLALGEQGLSALAYPGVTTDEADLGPFLASFETLAAGDVSVVVKFGVQYGLFGGSIYFLGTDEQRQRYLPDVAAGKLLGCFAMTETGHGSNVMKLNTVARYQRDGDCFVITTEDEGARKDYIGNAARDACLATVFAQLEIDGIRHGVHAFLVPIRDEDGAPTAGVRIGDDGHKLGLLGVDNGRLWFDDVRVPRDGLLARYAQVDADGSYQSDIASPNRRFFTMLSALVGGRVSVAAAAVTSAKLGLTIAIRYGARRRQFGAGDAEQAILDYTSYQRRLMPRLARTYACHAAVRNLQRRYLERTEDDARGVEALAAGIKAYATRHNTDTLQECRECCGGAGYLAESRIGPLMNDTDVFTTFEGDNTVLMLLVAKSLLGDFKAQFHDSRTFALIKLIARQAAAELTEKNPVQSRRTSDEHLDDRDFQLPALRYREQSLVRSVAMRMKKRIDDGMDAFAAQNQVQPHLLATARAHIERVVLEELYRAVDDSELAGPTRAVLGSVVDLYALSVLEEDAAWFIEQGYIEGSKFRAIRKRVTALCGELRPHAEALVDAFGLPPACIAAPIATTPVPPAKG